MALSKALDTLNLDDKYLLVAAIDFGTTYSGCAFSYKANVHQIFMSQKWSSSGGIESDKCPTCVLINPDGKFHSFGYEAEDDYNQLGSDSGYQLYRHFKMELHKKDISEESSVLSVAGHEEKAIEVFAMALKFLKDHMLAIINRALHGEMYEEEEIRWVLTVPAIWTNEAKHFMRQAALKAGMIKEPDSSSLIIALEPEAASLFCRLEDENPLQATRSKKKFKAGDKMLIIDAGGGTADITAHQLLSTGKVKEIAKPSGGPWGGTKVDDKFVSLLSNLFGPDFINHLKSKLPQQWLDFIMRFERSKKAFKDDGKYSINLSLPNSFSKAYKDLKGHDMETFLKESHNKKVTIKNGFFVIKHDVVLELYEECCSKIVNHVKELVQSLTELSYIFLVGGFGESVALQNALRRAFSGNIKIIVPLSPQLAIVKGAVLFGHFPKQILSRLSIATYGCSANLVFDEKVHDPSRKYKSIRDGQMRCKGTFREFVKIGEEIENSEVRTHTVHPKSKHETEVTIPILMSPKEEVLYSDEPQVYQIGKVKLESRDGESLGEDIDLQMTFGHTEIVVDAKYTKKGENIPVKTTLSFSMDHRLLCRY